ncbi:hypothetical protein ADK76_08505 [Streptomyces griseoflavus]|uniref:hypothetical protein n=1 Tax=Streptomyces rimosus TaxID=1927 RepID=UPI0004C8BFEA|nr:hypothetical protein [Streptomyces rimosus]KOG64697.1 hypothetical protein ADK76_08505 [Streptomyces griseoflavus]
MSHPLAGAACVEAPAVPLTGPEAAVVVIVVVLAVLLALTGMPGLSVFVLLAEATGIGVRLARRLRAAKEPRTERS